MHRAEIFTAAIFQLKKNLLPHISCGKKFILNNMQPGSDLKYNYRDVNGRLNSFHNCCCLYRWKILCVFLNSWKMKWEFFSSLSWPPPFFLRPKAILVVLKILTPAGPHSIKTFAFCSFSELWKSHLYFWMCTCSFILCEHPDLEVKNWRLNRIERLPICCYVVVVVAALVVLLNRKESFHWGVLL